MHTNVIGDLTHIDLWRKYSVYSIEGIQYYVLFVDNYSQYVTIEFLKQESQVTQAVHDYITHLSIWDHICRAIRVDCRTEFINNDLTSWCTQCRIEIHKTAPYSPSQNEIAEQMNRTLIKLACTMWSDSQLSEFLWESATAHVAYLHNRSFTRVIKDFTPYERWHGKKPAVSHLWDFRVPVWILSKDPSAPQKMLPKSLMKSLVSFDDESHTVKYYSKDTWKILTSQNYRFLDSTDILPTITSGNNHGDHETVPETVPDTSMQEISAIQLKKWPVEESEEPPHKKTRGATRDYKWLDSLFSDLEEDEDGMITIHLMNNDESYNAAMNDVLISLKEARKSPNWCHDSPAPFSFSDSPWLAVTHHVYYRYPLWTSDSSWLTLPMYYIYCAAVEGRTLGSFFLWIQEVL